MKLLHIDSSARRNSLITDEWTLAAHSDTASLTPSVVTATCAETSQDGANNSWSNDWNSCLSNLLKENRDVSY